MAEGKCSYSIENDHISTKKVTSTFVHFDNKEDTQMYYNV